MSKQCSVCGKEIIVGTTCMDCMKRAQEEAEEQARFDKAVSSVDYKKLTIRICLVVAILVASVGYAWITDDSDENEVAQNASQSSINVNEQSEETYYDTDEVYTEDDDWHELVETGEDGYRHFKFTKDEFVDKYNTIASYEYIIDDNVEIGTREFYIENASEDDLLLSKLPDIYKFYSFVSTRPYAVGTWCDNEDNMLAISVSCWGDFKLKTDSEADKYLNWCTYVCATITGKSVEESKQTVIDALNLAVENKEINDSYYEILFQGSSELPTFVIRVKNTNSYSLENESQGYNNSGSITSDYKSGESQENDSTTKIGGKATDFEVVGGSDIVYVISDKNYGVICPHCGYDMGACGTSSIWAEMSMYRAGETVSMPGWSMCASKFKGGCTKEFKYTVTIKFK